MSKVWDKIKNIDSKITLLIAVVASLGTVYNFLLPYFLELPSQRLNRYDKAFKVYNRIIEAETDIDKKVLKKYGIELYSTELLNSVL
jgi:hypothetical protein